ncbi:aconitate hydratase AcnA [Shewanella sp. A32]|uniref:aconitate hydratase AcnA n=1 Tax=Shewanella sp. A32 TaxID=3031327 RepID=UPI0023B97B69|nr:aconitate hydratase AcnA [Shewanella sp. A32]MDF0533953.1 aconitate hydratase AcnA [Shewanella sp. A32]
MSKLKFQAQAKRQLQVGANTYLYYSLTDGPVSEFPDVCHLPVSSKILLENILRHLHTEHCDLTALKAVANSHGQGGTQELAYHPARVLMQDFTGVPAIVDLAAMRAALVERGGDPKKINPLSKVDLVIDHSVSIEKFASQSAYQENVAIEMQRNLERYQFLKWGQGAFDNFSVVPPGTGICHQVNLEYLAKGVWRQVTDDGTLVYPDTLVGTDSHTTMINGLGVLGWGVGGIEAEAAMLGQPISMQLPDVVGFELRGKLSEGITATDLVLRVVQMLRQHGVVGKFVEFYGDGLDQLPLADRATIANMAPEYGATCGFFPVDAQTLEYLRLSGRDESTITLVEAYTKAQGLWRESGAPAPEFSATLSLDLSSVEPSLAGPKRPQDRVPLAGMKQAAEAAIKLSGRDDLSQPFVLAGTDLPMHHGDVVIAAITSCTNTSNPAVMLAAGLLAQKALNKGLVRKPWVKSSLAPGSKVVTQYLAKAGLQPALDALGFNLVGYGCTTCIGNSGPLPDNVTQAVGDQKIHVSSVLSGNRNFEGRIHPLVESNWLCSPPLVVAFALAGTTRIDLTQEPLGQDPHGHPVYLKDIWPSNAEIAALLADISRQQFREQYADVFHGDDNWRAIDAGSGSTYRFEASSTYIQQPPFFDAAYAGNQADIKGAAILALLGDSVTTDHISPAGVIPKDSPAAQYLRSHGVADADFNSYGSRRGNHEVMMRGTFGNIRIRNEMVPGHTGGVTRMCGEQQVRFIYDAAMAYRQAQIPTVVVAGKEYGTGSSRDWAAKGTLLLGVKAVIVESFERIHRSNLVGMGMLPLQFKDGENRQTLKLTGDEHIDIVGLTAPLKPNQNIRALIHYADGSSKAIDLLSRLDTEMEIAYYHAGGVLTYVLNRLARH